jgi:adenosylmethionine-8-amino-7-oxononanoate aminotransferase
MSEWNTEELIDADKRFVWHPFTDMRARCAAEHEPLVLVEGRGALLRDSRGREYIDGNSSIWTNIHGHNHPRINAAIQRQLQRVKELPGINEVRQCGFIAGIETERAHMAAAVCTQARRHGLLTRPIRNVVVLMPPLCITMDQLSKAVEALRASITEVSRSSNGSATKNVEEITA